MLCLSGFELYSRWVPLILVQNDTLCRAFSGLVHCVGRLVVLYRLANSQKAKNVRF